MSLRLEIDGAAAHLLIDRAEKKNALTMAMWEALPGLLDAAAADASVRLIVLRAAAPRGTFSAGADIRELIEHKDDAAWRAANQAAINRVQHRLARLALPTLAFIEGDCIGGGCGLALACDLRVATPAARFAITPARLGLVYPLHDVKLLTDLIGPGQAKRMLYTGGLIDAAEALRIGLIELVAAAPDALIAELLAASPHSLRQTKRFVRRVLDGQTDDDAETRAIFAAAFEGADFREGTAAFLAKRKAEFGR